MRRRCRPIRTAGARRGAARFYRALKERMAQLEAEEK
jgi:hypothetical protein